MDETTKNGQDSGNVQFSEAEARNDGSDRHHGATGGSGVESGGPPRSPEPSAGAVDGRPGRADLWHGPPGSEQAAGHRRRFEECLDLFDKGRFSEVRDRCDGLLGEDPDAEIRERVAALLGRMEIDLVAVWVAAACFVLIGLLAFFTLG